MNLEEFKKYFANAVIVENKIIIENNMHDALKFLSNEYSFKLLKEIIAIDNGNGVTELIYHLYSFDAHEDLLISNIVKYETETVTDIFKSAIADENEIYDLFGIKFIGNKNQKRLYMPQDWEGFPLRKDYIENDERLAWNDNNDI